MIYVGSRKQKSGIKNLNADSSPICLGRRDYFHIALSVHHHFFLSSSFLLNDWWNGWLSSMEVPATKYRDAKHIGLTLISNNSLVNAPPNFRLPCPESKHNKTMSQSTERVWSPNRIALYYLPHLPPPIASSFLHSHAFTPSSHIIDWSCWSA